MQTISEVAQDRIHRINKDRNHKNIETTAGLPSWLDGLVQNPQWAKRYAHLAKENAAVLRQVAECARQAGKPYNYMNKACSHSRWATTVKFWLKKVKTDKIAAEVIKRIKATKSQAKAIHGIVWRTGDYSLRYAITAQETTRDGNSPFRYFCWLTSRRRQAE